MATPVHVTFRGMGPSPFVTAAVEKHVLRLLRTFERITRCDVSVEAPPRHQRHGGCYRVRVDLRLPGAELVVGRAHEVDGAHEDVYVAARDAFRAARRVLEDRVRRMRGDVKTLRGRTRNAPPRGAARVARQVAVGHA